LEKNGDLAACLPSANARTQAKLTQKRILERSTEKQSYTEQTKHLFL